LKYLILYHRICLNTRLSKSSSSNFSISEFCERFPITPQEEEESNSFTRPGQKDHQPPNQPKGTPILPPKGLTKVYHPQASIFDKQNFSDERNLAVIKEERTYSQTINPSSKTAQSYTPDGLSSMNKDLFKSRISRLPSDHRNRVEVIPEEIKVVPQPINDPSDIVETQNANQVAASSVKNSEKSFPSQPDSGILPSPAQTTFHGDSNANSEVDSYDRLRLISIENRGENDPLNQNHAVQVPREPKNSTVDTSVQCTASTTILTAATQASSKPPVLSPAFSPINNNNNNEVRDFNIRNTENIRICPCEKPLTDADARRTEATHRGNDSGEKPTTSFSSTVSSPHNNYHSPQKVSISTSTTSTPTHTNVYVKNESLICEEKVGSETKARGKHDNKGLTNGDCAGKSLAANIEPTGAEVPLSTMSHQGERLGRNNTPSPSMSNNRVEALKYEGVVNMSKSKPGSRIMTNAHLKSMQKEYINNIAQQQKESISHMSNIEQCSASGSDRSLEKTMDSSICSSKSGRTEESYSPLPPRCQSENGHVKPKTIHTDSPIMSGFGSDRTRRRILYDYKIRRDYPELFGITPKDRRSFIKSLAEKPTDNDKSFIAPYYFSPLPTPKFPKRTEPSSQTPYNADIVKQVGPESPVKEMVSQRRKPSNVDLPQAVEKPPLQDIKLVTEVGKGGYASCSNEQFDEADEMLVEVNEQDDKTENDLSLKEIVRGILRNGSVDHDRSDDEESDDDDDDESEGGQDDDDEDDDERPEVHNRHRSPEESSNDSGISDEATTTEKSKGHGLDNERFQSNVAVNSSEVKPCPSNKVNLTATPTTSTTTTSNSTTSSLTKNNTMLEQKESMNIFMPNKSALACKNNSSDSPSNQSNKIDPLYFVEGEEETSMEEMVVLTRADKSTGTDDDGFFGINAPTASASHDEWTLNNKGEYHTRNLMAQRREAFFASYQSNSNWSAGTSSLVSNKKNSQPPPLSMPECPLIVKIVDGERLQSTIPEPPPPTTPPTERVQLTRLPEKERTTPRVERVESSDDSTSSDLASASPAAENGTTDPSWSSSSSSLAGCGSSKDEPIPAVASTSAAAASATVTYNNNENGGSRDSYDSYSNSSYSSNSYSVNGQCFASTSSRTTTNVVSLNDLSNGLPSSTFTTTTMNTCTSFGNSSHFELKGPEIVVTQESPDTPTFRNGYSSDGEEEEDSSIILCHQFDPSSLIRKSKEATEDSPNDSSDSERKGGFLRVESNDSTAENYGDDDDYNFDDEEDLSQCSVATINRYGTFESLEKIENEDSVGGLPDFSRPMPRSKARFTFEDEDSDDDNDLFEEDFESDFNFRFPSQIQDNTYSEFNTFSFLFVISLMIGVEVLSDVGVSITLKASCIPCYTSIRCCITFFTVLA
jgi:hypothetical protein